MNARPLKKPRGRRPKRPSAMPRRPSCRDCPASKHRGGCRPMGLWSGRRGDYVWFVRRGKQHRRLWVKPNDPRTPKQRRHRARLSATSAAYSGKLTDEQHDACIAAGAKRCSRPRLGDSGPHSGQQYWVHKELKGKPDLKGKKAPGRTQVPHSQRLAKEFKSQVPQPQPHTRTTWEPHRLRPGLAPEQHRCFRDGRASATTSDNPSSWRPCRGRSGDSAATPASAAAGSGCVGYGRWPETAARCHHEG